MDTKPGEMRWTRLDREREAEEKVLTEEQIKQQMRMVSNAYKAVFDTPQGRTVFKDLMEFCMTFQSTMTGNSYTYYNEGKRSVGLHVLMMREKGWENEIQLRRNEHKQELKEKEDEDAIT
jgi:hypothetical protein